MRHQSWLREVLEALTKRSVREDIPAAVAEYASRATSRRFCGLPWSSSNERRVESYYAAVVRRRIVRSRGGSKAVARAVAATVVEELRDSGRDSAAVWSELVRGWQDTIPIDVLEEYRVTLCA